MGNGSLKKADKVTGGRLCDTDQLVNLRSKKHNAFESIIFVLLSLTQTSFESCGGFMNDLLQMSPENYESAKGTQ